MFMGWVSQLCFLELQECVSGDRKLSFLQQPGLLDKIGKSCSGELAFESEI